MFFDNFTSFGDVFFVFHEFNLVLARILIFLHAHNFANNNIGQVFGHIFVAFSLKHGCFDTLNFMYMHACLTLRLLRKSGHEHILISNRPCHAMQNHANSGWPETMWYFFAKIMHPRNISDLMIAWNNWFWSGQNGITPYHTQIKFLEKTSPKWSQIDIFSANGSEVGAWLQGALTACHIITANQITMSRIKPAEIGRQRMFSAQPEYDGSFNTRCTRMLEPQGIEWNTFIPACCQ